MEPLDPTAPEAPADEPRSAFRPNKLTSGIVAGGAAFAMVLAGLGIANAQTADSGSGSSDSNPPAATSPAAGPGEGEGAHHHRPRAVVHFDLQVAATTLGTTVEDLRTQLQSGKSLADIAGDKTDALIAAIVKATEDHLAVDVDAGRLTQAEADARKENLTERVTKFVHAVPPAKGEGDGPGRPGHPGIRAELSVVAKTIGITEADLRSQLESGKSIAAIAGDKTDAVIQALVADRQAKLDQAVKDGKLTQAQADERKADLTERITELVNRTPPAPGEGPRGDHGPGPGDRARPSLATVAGVLGISEDDLRTQLQSGKTLAAIAGDKTPQVVDALVAEAQARLDQAAKDGRLTQAQADERKADLTQRITDMVNRTPRAGGPGRHHGGPDGDGPGGDGVDGPSAAQPESQPASVTA